MHALPLLFCYAAGALAQTSASESDSTFTLQAVRVPAPPTIDGAVTDAEWDGAALAGDFIQYEPARGSPSEVRTQAFIAYDSTHLYVAFRLWDDRAPTAQLTRRDADLQNDDAVVVVLDSHNDHQSGYYFMTNLLGTQTDGRIANDGRTVDKTWDAPWVVAAQATSYGWTAEFAIPFTSIKYTAGRQRTWGINLGRSRRRTLEMSFWAGPLEHPFRVSQGGQLVGLDVPPPERRYQAILYSLSRLQQDTTDEVDAGGDLRYAVTPELSAYLTVNPDFATIEADQERINLTRFELSLPEKRPFFLEGAQLFRQRIRTFYSRRIPDIRAGAKLLGKEGPWTIAAVATRTERNSDVDPATFGVTRLQRDLLGSSSLAAQFANRTLNGVNQGSMGLDATLFFTRTLGMTAQLVRSWGEFDTGTWGYFVRPSYDSPTGHFHVRYTHLGEHFGDHVNAVGFVRDDDRRELDAALERTFWIRSRTFDAVEYGSNYNIYWSQSGLLRSWKIDQSLDIEFHNRVTLDLEYTEEFKRFEDDFRNRQLGFELGYNTREFQSATVGYQFGRNFNADYRLLTAAAGYKVTPDLAVEYELERLVLEPDPEAESTWIHVIRASQFFTKDLYIRLFFQANSSIDRQNVQAVFVYRYRPPFGTIQLAYERGKAGFGERSEQGNTLFLKLTAVF